ncbi:MAG TPA: dihydropteroate synthase, partial [Ktedonobacteraceae bacterium]|nr:dihydropteroate synthase [Ktedonobacteraceae bacterium]
MPALLPATTWSHHQLVWGQQTYVMGIANVTPDSFSGDGLARDTLSEDKLVQRTITLAKKFVAQGATLIDVGGESTRPHSPAISVEQELARVIPVLRALREALPPEIIISIDTYKAQVADQALRAGASVINDIWALRRDPEMAGVAREHGVPVILMANMRG